MVGRDLLEEATAEYPGGNFYDVQMPLALAYSVDVLEDRYDAVVVDEGQDFRDEYWFPIELLLADQDKSPLYIFYDQNQALYTKVNTFPVRDEPYVLTANCRNTRVIHGLSYRFFRGDSTEPPEIDGLPLEVIESPSVSSQAWKIQRFINKLLLQDKIAAKDIVILVCDAPNKGAYYDALSSLPLPLKLSWSIEDHHALSVILADTVRRFKGLEAHIIILWLGESGVSDEAREVLYVGTSRAKSLLCLVGSSATCNRVLNAVV
jgi:superfamily I DNA and RNA helicase